MRSANQGSPGAEYTPSIHRRRRLATAPCLALLLLLAPGAAAQSTPDDSLQIVSTTASGGPGDADALNPAVSADGRYVVFESSASNLVSGDTNGHADIFVHAVLSGQTSRVSVSSGGAQSDGPSFKPTISADGRYVAFESQATNLVAADLNGVQDIFVHDTTTGTTTRASLGPSGAEADAACFDAVIAASGTVVAFTSVATNLVSGIGNGVPDVFLRDLVADVTSRASVSTAGIEANGGSGSATLSYDGLVVAFQSFGDNLVAGDTNNRGDVFLRDTATGTTTRVSVSSAGAQGDEISGQPALSIWGDHVAFWSEATNLVANDTNGLGDVFVRDTGSGLTQRASTAPGGIEGNDKSGGIFGARLTISHDARYLLFSSKASNLVSGDFNGTADVFVRDIVADSIRCLSRSPAGTTGNGISLAGTISFNGRTSVLGSGATNLTAGPGNTFLDVLLFKRSPWDHLGGAIAGLPGAPLLRGDGSLLAGAPGSLTLSNAVGLSPAVLVVADSLLTPLGVGGGFVQPWPPGLIIPGFTDAMGELSLGFTFPAGILPGTELYFQYVILDTSAPQSLAISNLLAATFP